MAKATGVGQLPELLREMKPRSPINGLILFVKVEDVIERDPKKRAATVETLRRALQDVEHRLQVRVPVYVMVTMCDRLVGFVDFFGHLRGIADRTLFGWSRPGAFDATWSAEAFRQGTAALADRVGRSACSSRGGQPRRHLRCRDHKATACSPSPRVRALVCRSTTSCQGPRRAPTTSSTSCVASTNERSAAGHPRSTPVATSSESGPAHQEEDVKLLA
jgi:hypothetical protein